MKHLKRYGFKASIITSSLFPNTPEASVFNEKLICGNGNYAECFSKWILYSNTLIEKERPALIWAHHFDLFPAWLISRLYSIPLLTTFHGPLIEVNRPNDLMQALGMTLAIHRGDAISGVSKEIIYGIKRLVNDKDMIHLIPNSIEISKNEIKPVRYQKPKKFLLITRPQKLGHLRNAVLLFNTYRKRVKGSSLTIAGGINPNDKFGYSSNRFSNFISNLNGSIKYLGGKWILEQGSHFLSCLLYIKYKGYIANPRFLIRDYDVVLGMGRVLLEGISEGKPSVLIGYDKICGLLTQESFEKYQWSNFSGRGILPQTGSDICDSILDYCGNGRYLIKEYLDTISASKCSKKLKELITILTRSYKIDADEVKLAKELAKIIKSNSTNASNIFSFVCSKLSTNELTSLYNLSVG